MPKRARASVRGVTAAEARTLARRADRMSYGYKRRYRPKKKFERRVMRVVNNLAETKIAMKNCANNLNLQHNTLVTLETSMCDTTHGNASLRPDLAFTGNRIGKRIYAKGLQIRIKLENDQKQPGVQYRIYVYKVQPGQLATAPSTLNFYQGVHTDKLMDYQRGDLYKCLYVKNVKVVAPNQGTTEGHTVGPGNYNVRQDVTEEDERVIMRGQKVLKFWIPIKKTIEYPRYEAGSGDDTPIYDHYGCCVMAYSNYNTTTGNIIGYCDMSYKFYYTDV